MTALDNWLRAAAAAWTSSGRYEGPLFRRVTRSGPVSGHVPLSTNAVRAIVRKRAAAVGVEGVSGHSCRVGSAQSLIERAASTAAVAIAGRWKDPGMVVRYAKAQEAGRGAVKTYFGGKVSALFRRGTTAGLRDGGYCLTFNLTILPSLEEHEIA